MNPTKIVQFPSQTASPLAMPQIPDIGGEFVFMSPKPTAALSLNRQIHGRPLRLTQWTVKDPSRPH